MTVCIVFPRFCVGHLLNAVILWSENIARTLGALLSTENCSFFLRIHQRIVLSTYDIAQ